MTESDKVKMTINIGGEILRLTVPFKLQDLVRDAEQDVNKFYTEWRRKYPTSTPGEVLAMVAYQFAYSYHELNGVIKEASQITAKSDDLLSQLLDNSAHF